MNGILILLALALATTPKKTKDEVLMTVGTEEVTVSEFENIFQKNNDIDQVSEEDLKEYLDLYVKFKMKVLDAEEMQLDTAASFQKELAGYRKQLARPYLTDKQAEEALVTEAYSRMLEEVRASHILLLLDEDALPKDTLAVYNKMMSLREKVRNGADFSTVAKEFSEDPSAKSNGGDLGYFSAFRMVYPFESAAFNTPVGSVSKPFRTRFGYHILEVTDKRKSRGEVKVAHIMVEEGEKASELDKKVAADRLTQMKEFFDAGKSFEELVRYSDDAGSVKNGGELAWFGTGKMVPEFEEAAFALEHVGDLSEPVKTMYGWHFIKLLDKRGVPSFEEAKGDIEKKIKRDSRSSRGREMLIKRIKKENNFREQTAKLEPFYGIDLEGEWEAEGTDLKGTLFSLAGETYTQKHFASYIEANKTPTAKNKTAQLIHTMYQDWVEKTCIALENDQLEEKYPEFKALMQEYRDGILLFDLMDQKVWGKAVLDTVGLQQYYDLTKENYRWGPRVDAAVFTCLNEAVAARVRKMAANRTSVRGLSQEDIAILSLGKGELYLSDEDITAIVNRENALNVQLESRHFSKGANAHLDQAAWVTGLTANELVEGTVVFADIKQALGAAIKTLSEAKGEVTANYQDYLEAAWLKELEEKYPVQINEEVLQSILK